MAEQVWGVRGRPVGRFAARTSAGLILVAIAGVVFAWLLELGRETWVPLADLDRSAAGGLHARLAGSDLIMSVLRGVSDTGGRTTLILVLLIGAAYLLIRRQPGLAGYLVLTAGGAFVLDLAVKLLVERVRPALEASTPGAGFPSGHALDSLVGYGALLLVFLPALPRRWRSTSFAVVALLLVLVGLSRIALGVHYLTDVLAGWALGIGWLTVTAVAFRAWRREAGTGTGIRTEVGARTGSGRRLPPLREGLAPEAADQIRAVPDRDRDQPAHRRRKLIQLIVAWTLVLAALLGLGALVTAVLADSPALAFDQNLVRWLAANRTPGLTSASRVGSALGSTYLIIMGTLAASGLVLAVARRWRPVIFLVVVMLGEITLFLVAAAVVGRPRPPVKPLNPNLPPTASFPSGHVAGVLCLTLAIAVLVWHAGSRPWGWTAVTAAVLLPAAVAVSRLYRGVHHPTDVLGSVLLALPWVAAVWWVIHPRIHPHLDGPGEPGSRRRASGVIRWTRRRYASTRAPT